MGRHVPEAILESIAFSSEGDGLAAEQFWSPEAEMQ